MHASRRGGRCGRRGGRELTRDRIAGACAAGGVLLLLLVGALTLPAEGPEAVVVVDASWPGTPPPPGQGWIVGDGPLEAGPDGAVSRGSLEIPEGSLPWVEIGASSGAALWLRGSSGSARLARPLGSEPGGRIVLVDPGEGPEVELLLTAPPGGRLHALRAGYLEPGEETFPLPWIVWAVWLACSLVLLVPRPSPRAWSWVLLGLFAAAAFTLAWLRWETVHLDALEPDASQYKALAGSMDHPWDSGGRAPLWPGFLRLWTLVAPATPASLRLVGVFLVLLVPPASCFLVSRLFDDRAVGLLAAGMTALHPLVMWTGPRALRAPLFLVLVALTAGLAASGPFRGRWPALGAAAGLVCMVRLEALLFVAVACAVAVWRDRPRLPGALAAAGLFAVLLGPWIGLTWWETGDPLSPLGLHSKGVASRLDRAEGGARDPQPIYEGEEVGPLELVLDKVGPLRFAARWAQGWGEITLVPTSRQASWLLGSPRRGWILVLTWPLWLAGAILWLLGPRRWGLLLLLGAGHVLPFVQAGVPSGMDPRYLAHLVPFLAGAAALAALRLARRWSLQPEGLRSRLEEAVQEDAP